MNALRRPWRPRDRVTQPHREETSLRSVAPLDYEGLAQEMLAARFRNVLRAVYRDSESRRFDVREREARWTHRSGLQAER